MGQDTLEVDLDIPTPGKVMVGYITRGEVKQGFGISLSNARDADRIHGWNRFDYEGNWYSSRASSNIWGPRNELAWHFLGLEAKPEWLVMIDDDMVFAPETIENLIRVADPNERPIVGALCFAWGKNNSIIPTIFDSDKYGIAKPILDYPDDTLIQVALTGAAFLLVHRSVLEKIQKDNPDTKYPFYREVVGAKDNKISEDFFFCMQAGMSGFPIFVHTGIEVEHIKEIKLNSKLYKSNYSALEPV